MMPMPVLLLSSVLLASAPLTAGEKSKPFTFNKNQDGKVPAGWKVASTGKDAASAWSVVADDTAPGKTGHVLMQTGVLQGPAFNLCVQDDSNFLDGEIEVAFKAVKGEKDQGGGIVWRYQDANNYYIARMNPLEDNVRVYKVVDGKRIESSPPRKIWYVQLAPGTSSRSSRPPSKSKFTSTARNTWRLATTLSKNPAKSVCGPKRICTLAVECFRCAGSEPRVRVDIMHFHHAEPDVLLCL